MKKGIIIVFAICIAAKMCSCNNDEDKNGYFVAMKESYKDLTFEDLYYLKGFGISKKKFKINNRSFRKISCEEGSIFYLAGFIRSENDKIFLIPTDYLNGDTLIEKKLFDFNARENESWQVYLSSKKGSFECMDVTYIGSYVQNNQPVYKFKLVPYEYYTFKKQKNPYGYEHFIEVSKKEGIRKIVTTQEAIRDTIANCSLYPSVDFHSKGWNFRPI